MMKIDRAAFDQEEVVVKLVSANHSWDGEGNFSWNILINGRGFKLRELILPILLKMTNKHCAFCDWHPLDEDLFPISIEHYYPKSKGKYPNKAYQWDNLFPSCYGCTHKKDDKFDEKLLRPDSVDYYFESFFEVTGDGEMKPSCVANEELQKRAQITIDIYKLNRGVLKTQRRKHITIFSRIMPEEDINEYPFRFLYSISKGLINSDDIIKSFISND